MYWRPFNDRKHSACIYYPRGGRGKRHVVVAGDDYTLCNRNAYAELDYDDERWHMSTNTFDETSITCRLCKKRFGELPP